MEEQAVLVHSQQGTYGEINIYKRIVDGLVYYSYRDETGFYQSNICMTDPLVSQAHLSMTVLAQIYPTKSVLILGAGLFANAVQMSILLNGGGSITVVDTEACLHDLARKYMELDKYKNIHFFAQDAMKFVFDTNEKYDYIIVDLFQGLSVPVQFLTDYFFSQVNNILSDEGVVVVNSSMPEVSFLDGRNPDKVNPVKKLEMTLYQSGFTSIYINDVFRMGMLYAFKRERDILSDASQAYKMVSDNMHSVRASLLVIASAVYKANIDSAIEAITQENSFDTAVEVKRYIFDSVAQNQAQTEETANIYDCLSDITYKYFLKKFKKASSGFGIDDLNYYDEIVNLLKKNEIDSTNELLKYVYMGPLLETIIREDIREMPVLKYFLAMDLIRKNKAEESEKLLVSEMK